MFLKIILCILLSTFIYSKEYMIIDKNDWIAGAIKLDINFANGAFGSKFGIFLDDNTIITSSAITNIGFPSDINVKIKDSKVDLIICIAKARLVVSDENTALAMLKITHYTDDYCNYSNKKLYHQELINNQKINFRNNYKSKEIETISDNSPFLIQNYKKTIIYEQGFPYFDKNGRFIGISSNNNIINIDSINKFMQRFRYFKLQD
ncbi:hypothetical protein CCY99_05150 [Helicobacter sp. 16-1353]|uniref:hypothetical protein n=1 Tax=Helicobacter sp. 16-1353 TaxID=2004996 RepID=UPI000DCBB820|nr:hypothetical protein [Helicobacter sp. 16-1353]RAX54069.1 hypothetical protein CCY99_05150 [Helicobacter sp. 16-1353]